MRDEVGEHMARDLRPFLHTVSLQILQILRSTLVDSASALSTDFLWGLGRGTDGHGKTFILQSVNNFCVDFEVCFGSLSCWKVQPRPIYWRGLLGFHFISAGISWESLIPCILTRCPWLWKKNSPTTSKIRHHTSQWVWGAFLYGYLSVYAKPTFAVCCQKALLWSHLTI